MSDDNETLLTPEELAQRWSVSVKTLTKWRYEGSGPLWLKIGGQARYRLADVLQYEREAER